MAPVLGAALALFAAVTACRPEPHVEIVYFGPIESVQAVGAGGSTGLAVEVANPGNLPLTYRWQAGRGQVRAPADDAPAATYLAPEEPGVDTVTVKVLAGGRVVAEKALAIDVLTTGTASPPGPACAFEQPVDAATLVALVEAECRAVLTRDLSIVEAIFAPDAAIRDEATRQRWTDPVARYATLFANATYESCTHFEIQPAGPGIAEGAAWFTSGSHGAFRAAEDPGALHDFWNAAGSDHWTFGRIDGCWRITSLAFNAGHVPFPP